MSERKTFFADIILPLAVDLTFTYRVPFELNDTIKNGVRVVVPFGKSKLYTGIVVRVHEEIPKEYQAKYIEHVLDESPIITGKQLKLWKWISEYYMAPIGDVMNAALPGNFKLASETKIVLHPDFDRNYDELNDKEYLIVEALDVQDTLDLKEISQILQQKSVHALIKKLIDRRVVMSVEEMRYKYTPKTATFVQLNSQFSQEEVLSELVNELEQDGRKKKQFEALMHYLKAGGFTQNTASPVRRSELVDAGASLSALNTLEKNGILESLRLEISRLNSEDTTLTETKELSPEQTTALQQIRESFQEKDVCLLHGVTGSGKTEIYVELIQEQLAQGRQVLFLLPEIALTTQLIDRLSAYFGDLIGVYHSKFNQNERVEIWNSVLRDDPTKFRIILGARSSVFLPFKSLGLIIVDEEHENTFKQYDPSPRYHARDVSIVLSHLHGAKTLLGTATPSIETYFNAQEGKYGFVELSKRFGGIQMPEIQCADLKKERRRKTMHSLFSSFLLEEMKTALDNKEQIILFQNRRGYTPIWICEVCNWSPKCKNCDVSLTYHKHSNMLKCHYCSYTIPPVGTCSNCGSNRLHMHGFGTEKVEDELSLLLPGVTISRLDLDSTRSKDGYQKILEQFGKKEVDVLVGTQMVTKGLDFDNVSLVGILDADMMLRYPDFRSFERSFQLMSQVAGRAGRRNKRGKVIIQTGTPEHWIIQQVMHHDYVTMYKQELIERKNFGYPPYTKLIYLTLKHKSEQQLEGSAADLAQQLKAVFGSRIIGPEYPLVRKIQNSYIKIIRIKMEREASHKKIKGRLQEIINQFYASPVNKSVRISIDVDPV